MTDEFEHIRSGVKRRMEDCPKEGCTPVILIGSKLNWVLTLLTVICGLLGSQTFFQIPAIRADMNEKFKVSDERLLRMENQIKQGEKEDADNKSSIQSLEASVYTNRVAIRRVSRPVNTTIRRQEIYVIPAKPTATLPPADRHEIWRQK